jgi:hypothetical protein
VQVRAAVDFVTPTVRFPPQQQEPLPPVAGEAPPALGLSAAALRTLYSVGDTVGAGVEGNRHAVTGFLGQHFHPGDFKVEVLPEEGGHSLASLTPLRHHADPLPLDPCGVSLRRIQRFWKAEMKGVNASLPAVKEVGDEVEGGLAGIESMLDIEYVTRTLTLTPALALMHLSIQCVTALLHPVRHRILAHPLLFCVPHATPR